MDRSVFIHHGTGIPRALREFFNHDYLSKGKKKKVKVNYNGKTYHMTYSCDQINRTRLIWDSTFSSIIQMKFDEIYNSYKNDEDTDLAPEMIFFKMDNDEYNVEFVEEAYETNQESIPEAFKEGAVKYYYSTRYERDINARKQAINYHGYDCKACGFNFENKYGKVGAGFIEIHHSKPLYMNHMDVEIDPLNDLIPVCSNCHRMIHRKRHHVLSISEIINLIANK